MNLNKQQFPRKRPPSRNNSWTARFLQQVCNNVCDKCGACNVLLNAHWNLHECKVKSEKSDNIYGQIICIFKTAKNWCISFESITIWWVIELIVIENCHSYEFKGMFKNFIKQVEAIGNEISKIIVFCSYQYIYYLHYQIHLL